MIRRIAEFLSFFRRQKPPPPTIPHVHSWQKWSCAGPLEITGEHPFKSTDGFLELSVCMGCSTIDYVHYRVPTPEGTLKVGWMDTRMFS